MPPQQPLAAPQDGPASWEDVVRAIAEQEGVPVPLALAVGKKESALVPSAVGDGGKAVGMFQLHEGAAMDAGGTPEDRADPVKNIKLGMSYLKQLNARYKGDVTKVLQAYNGGMGNVDKGTVSPEAQAYAAEVIANLSQNIRQTARASAPPAPVQSTVPAATPAAPQRQQQAPPASGSMIGDFIGGARAQLAKTIYGGGDLIRRTLGMERVINDPSVQAAMTAPPSTAGSIGRGLTEVAEFAIPGAQITKVMKGAKIAKALISAGVRPARAGLAAAAAEGGAQATAAGAIAKVHGDDPTATAIISAATPIAAQMITSMAPAIRQAATTKMARFMERGLRGHITPEQEKNLAQAASDFIDLPLQRTWRQTARLTGDNRKAMGKTLGDALAGPLGDTPVPVAPVMQGLDELIEAAQHVVPAGKGEFRTVTFKPGVIDAVNNLKTILAEYDQAYAGAVPARQLHDLKQVWYRTVYPLKEAAQPIGSTRELLTTAQKEAYMRGAVGISKVLSSHAPSIASLDEAVSHAARLDQFVKRLSNKARTSTLARPEARYAIGAVGGAAGVAAGSAVGHPIIGAHVGYATARLLINAIESPKWRLLPMSTRRQLSDALARGDADRARKLLLPVTQAIMNDEDSLLKAVDQSNRAAR